MGYPRKCRFSSPAIMFAPSESFPICSGSNKQNYLGAPIDPCHPCFPIPFPVSEDHQLPCHLPIFRCAMPSEP